MSDIVDKIRAALNHIGSDNRSQWVEAAMAIKSELGDAGFELWNQWSQTSDSYNAKSAQSVWRTANSTKIGIGTLFWRAQQNGFDLSEFRSDTPVDRAAIEAMAKKQREAREAQEAVRLEKQKHAAELATVVLKTAAPAGSDHPYLIKKGLGGGLTPHNLREIKAEKLAQVIGYTAKSDDTPLVGRILVGPVGDSAGVTTVEFVDESGQKAALAGGRKSAAWWAASPLVDNPDQVIVCEGIATASSIAAAEHSSGRNSVVVAALSDTNIPNVAEVMRERYPSSRMVIASDLGNGEKKAQEAAKKTGAFYVVPSFPANATINGTAPTDFNDLHQVSGLGDVAALTSGGNRIQKRDNLEQTTTDRLDTALPSVVQSAQDQIVTSEDGLHNPASISSSDVAAAFRLGEKTAIDTATRRMDRFVAEFERGTLKDSDTQLLGEAPTVLRYLGAPDVQLQISGAAVRKILAGKHKFDISPDNLRHAARSIHDPLAVFESATDSGLVVLSELLSRNENPVVAIVHLGKKQGGIIVNDIASVYEKSDIDKSINSWIDLGLLRYVRNEKDLTRAATRHLLPASIATTMKGLIPNISTVLDVVKHYQSRYLQASPNLETTPRPVENRMNPTPPATPNSETRRDFRQELTDALIERIRSGTAPWQKPWVGGPQVMPYNAVTGKPYRGANNLWLSMAGYSDPRFATYRQAVSEGWQVRKGERGLPIEYWKTHTQRGVVDKDGKPVLDEKGKQQMQTVKLERPAGPFHATVFNLSQMDNVPPLPDAPTKYEWDPVLVAESLLTGSQATIVHDQNNRAFYSPSSDSIHLPAVSQFPSAGDYYGTALHELAHWTGHETRLNRDLGGAFGSEPYAREELRAELTSYMLAAQYGIPHDVNRHASYVENWVGALLHDKNEIFRASREADSMIDFITAPLRSKDISVDSPAPPPPEPIEPVSAPAPEQTPAAAQPSQSNSATARSAGAVLYPVDSIPGQVKEVAKTHYGSRMTDFVPREHGGPYKGEIYVAGDYYVQAVSNRSMVYHRKDRLSFPEGFDPNGKDVLIRYQNGNGQGLAHDPQKEQFDRAIVSLTRAAQRLGLPDDFKTNLATARDVAWKSLSQRREGPAVPKSVAPEVKPAGRSR